MTAPQLWTPEQAAERLAVNPAWLRRKAGQREIPHVLVADQIRFRDEDLAAIVAAGERLPQSAADVIPRREAPATPQNTSARLAPVIEARPNARRIKPRTA